MYKQRDQEIERRNAIGCTCAVHRWWPGAAYGPATDCPLHGPPPNGRIFSFSPLVWTDVETTGLDPFNDEILEIGMVATDHLLKRIPNMVDLQIVVKPDELDIMGLNPIVAGMHSGNGLLVELVSEGALDRNSARGLIRDWLNLLRNEVYEKTGEGKFLMAGSTVGQFDRQFFGEFMPSAIKEFFEYRVLDVSSVKEIIRRLHGEDAVKHEPNKIHRVIPDIEASIEELNFYLERYFV